MTEQPDRPDDPIGRVPWPMFGPLIVQRMINRTRQNQQPSTNPPSRDASESSRMKTDKAIDPSTALILAHQQLQATRKYIQDLLDNTSLDLWYQWPSGVGSHMAWQVGHLAMAQYRLCIVFVRPELPGDQRIISADFLKAFGRGSQARPESPDTLPAAELLRRYNAVCDHVMDHWNLYEELDMLAPALVQNHRIVRSRLDALFWASRHAMIHAGQIGLIRRGLGLEPIW